MKTTIRTLLLCVFFCSTATALAQHRIRSIYIDQREVFSKEEEEKLFAFAWLNALHINTQEYIIDDELLFREGDLLNDELLQETERNLLGTGFFKDVTIEIDTISDIDVDIYVVARERWTTMPYIKAQTGGGTTNLGGGFRELNLAGVGTHLSLYGGNRSENNIGAEGEVILEQRRLFRSEFNIGGKLKAHALRTDQAAYITKPFRTLATTSAYSGSYTRSFGSDFYYGLPDTVLLLPFQERSGTLWYSHAFARKDRYFITGAVSVLDVDRIDGAFRRATDNAAKVLIGFASIKQTFHTEQYLNTVSEEHISTGAWGTAILGRIVSLRSGVDNLYYAGGQIEQSAMFGPLYVSGQVSAGSGFAGSDPRYTYQEFLGHAFYRASPRSVIAARLRQQTVWNWAAFRQLVLDNDMGLRGYQANGLIGDNRIVANVEYRFFPDFDLLSFRFSGAVFYDVGTVWNQSKKLHQSQVYHSAGLGLRIHNDQLLGPYVMFRIDVPYNFHERKPGQIVLSIGQLFSAFKHPQFEVPKIFGEDIDVQ